MFIENCKYFLYLTILLDKQVLVLVVDDLHQLVPAPCQPEQGGGVLQVTQLVVEPGDGVVGQGEVCTDALGPVLLCSGNREHRTWHRKLGG